MTTTKSRLGQTLSSGRLAVTAECLPPLSGDAGAVKKLAALLPDRLDAVVVADNCGQIAGSALACAAILAAEGRPAVLSLVTRDRNRIALENDALGAAALGIATVFCISGDHQSLGICPQAAGAYDIDSIQLTQALKKMMRDGHGFNGHTIDPLPEFLVGAAAHPYLQPMELGLLRLRKKIAAGADFLLTQAVSDLAGFTRWMDAAREAGLDRKVAIIASVQPNEGVATAAEMAVKLKSIPGVRGIHILSGGCEALAASVIQEAGLV
jgi:methylenetetrahydrofolate reductase (NADPH)